MLQISYHATFKNDESTILIRGSEQELKALWCVLAEWRGETLSILTSLRHRVSLRLDGLTDFVLTVARDRESRADLKHGNAVWLLSLCERDRIVGLLEALCLSSKAGHQYLDNGAGSIQILCSKGEYPSNLGSASTL